MIKSPPIVVRERTVVKEIETTVSYYYEDVFEMYDEDSIPVALAKRCLEYEKYIFELGGKV